jgi:DNA-binding NarL/FixJ family response regulator
VRVVVADDAAALRAVVSRIVRAAGGEVVAEAVDAPSLLRLLPELAADAVVIDGRLPPDGALAAIPHVRAALPQARIFVVASLGETALVRAAVAAGASGALARPLVAARIRAALDGDARTP